MISPSQSIGFHKASTTLQISPSQTGTSRVFQVEVTFSHSFIELNHDNTTIQT